MKEIGKDVEGSRLGIA